MAAVTSVDPLIVDVDKVFWIGCANKYVLHSNLDFVCVLITRSSYMHIMPCLDIDHGITVLTLHNETFTLFSYCMPIKLLSVFRQPVCLSFTPL
jgi:hypothetical protein